MRMEMFHLHANLILIGVPRGALAQNLATGEYMPGQANHHFAVASQFQNPSLLIPTVAEVLAWLERRQVVAVLDDSVPCR